MKLNVEVDSGAFEKVIEDGIKALSKEDLGNIIKQVVYEAFTKCEEFKDMLIIREKVGWNCVSEVKIGPLAAEAIKSVNMEEQLAEFKKKMCDCLIENHQKIVEDMLLRCFIDKITWDDHFMHNMREVIRHIANEDKNRGRG